MRIKRILAICISLSGSPALLFADPGPLELWYTSPATSWTQEALPVGNGRLAAMIFGGISTEQIQFNEETIWTGQPHFYENPAATVENLKAIQARVFTGQRISTTEKNNFMSVPLRQAMYQPAGSLTMTWPHANVSEYRRSLGLDTATATVTYRHNGIQYRRDVFASAPDDVIVIRLTATEPGSISFSYTFSTLQPVNSVSLQGTDLVLHARVSVQPRPEYFATGLTNAIEYEARVRILTDGGSVTTTGGKTVNVVGANSVTLLLGAASNFVKYDDLSADPSVRCLSAVDTASAKTFDELRAAQLEDYQSLFRRVALDLGATAKTNLPINQRIRRIQEGDDPQLSMLYFQLGRYLMISGSRPGSQPLTLQGKWNDTTNPSWESKMTLNINQQLNYSGAEVCNLSECHEPMFEMAKELAVTGARVAGTNYGARGWVVHHNTDLWRGAAPINNYDGIWPAGQAWLCQNLWWHYEFTGDTNFLATTAYPLIKSAAEFFQDFLVPHPANTNWLVTNPSYSSEHDHPQFGVPNVAGPTMDNELLRELFTNIARATQVLGIDAAFRTNILALRHRLPPQQIGKYGQLQEWLEDVDGPNDTHRHCSHLVGLWPGKTISPFYNPIVAAAAKVSTDIRGNGDIGWGKAWRANLRARLLDGDRAYLILTNMIADPKCSTNLVFHDNPNRQVDAIFGAMNAMAELLLQSQSGEVFLLPALPSKWSNGSVTGLCARGGFEVDITWRSNRLASATIRSKLGNTCRVRSKWPITVKRGTTPVHAPMILPGVWEFATSAGSAYTIEPAKVFEAELLPVASNNGGTHTTVSDLAFSEGRGTRWTANAIGASITYGVTNIQAGRYRVIVVADCGRDRVQFQLAGGPAAGELADLGPVHDTFSATNFVYLLSTNSPPASYLSTNMLREFDCGEWTIPADGDYEVRFTAMGSNNSSTGKTLVLDYIRLIPIPTTAALSVRVDQGQLVLSWPQTGSSAQLLSSTSLLSGTWSPIANAPQLLNGLYVITNDLLGDRIFYRLSPAD